MSNLLFSVSLDTLGPLQLLRHCPRPLAACRSFLPHPLLLLPSWWGGQRCRGRRGGWRCQLWPWIRQQKGAGHLLCHMGIGCSRDVVLVIPVNDNHFHMFYIIILVGRSFTFLYRPDPSNTPNKEMTFCHQLSITHPTCITSLCRSQREIIQSYHWINSM